MGPNTRQRGGGARQSDRKDENGHSGFYAAASVRPPVFYECRVDPEYYLNETSINEFPMREIP